MSTSNMATIEKPKIDEYPIHKAIASGNILEVKAKIKEYPSHINLPDKYNYSPLMTSSELGFANISKVFVENGADINFKGGEYGSAALHIAAQKGKTEVLKFLLQCGSDVDMKNDIGIRPLHMAALNDHVDIVQLLTSYQCDLNAVCKIGDTGLHFAAYGGSIETVKLLIKKGASFNQPNQGMLTPIHEAAMKGHIEVVKYLINNGVDIDCKGGKFGSSLLHLAAQFGKPELVAVLLERGSNINIKNNMGSTPLLIAIRNKNYNIVKLLIDQGCDIYAMDKERNTVFHFAAFLGCFEIVKLLIEKGALLNEKNIFMSTPLREAAIKGNFEIVKFLLENGADVNSVDVDWNTSLHLAIRSDDFCIKTVKVLLDYGADYRKKNNAGFSVLDLCKEDKNWKIMELILSKMMNDMEMKDSKRKDPKPVQFTLDECVICNGHRDDVFALYPCGHAKTCEMCCLNLLASPDINSVCPICRSRIDDYKKIYV